MASASKKAHKLDGSDSIFRLPEEILQKFFFFLPVEDAVTLSSSSKAWRNLWTSLPVLNLSFNHDENVTLEDFVASIEKSLSALRSRSATIDRFLLAINPPEKEGSNLQPHLDDWLYLVTKNYVKEIDLRVSDSDYPQNIFYTLPQSVFTSKSLVKLQLIGCKFPTSISFPDNGDDDHKKSRRCHDEFLRLQEITLEDVIARDDQIQRLMNLSRNSLEKMTIKTYPPMEFLFLIDFPKLEFMEVNVKSLRVEEAMNLETMVSYGLFKVYAIGVSKIKTLRCLTWFLMAYQWIRLLVSALPVLETLQLHMICNEMIRIKSPSLKNLFLCEGQRFQRTIEVRIDAPKLNNIYFTGFSFPEIRMVRRGSNNKVDLHHLGHPSGGIDSSQLFKLGRFSLNPMDPLVEIHLHQIVVEDLLTLAELRAYPIVYRPMRVKMVVLECIPEASSYSYFLDALFWTCHPTRLLLLMNQEETLNSPYRVNFIRYLVDEILVKRETKAAACCPQGNRPKCWRHHLSDATLELYRSTHQFEAEELAGMPVQVAHNGAFTLVQSPNKGIVAEFMLMWLPHPV